jgi:hypothetical protein
MYSERLEDTSGSDKPRGLGAELTSFFDNGKAIRLGFRRMNASQRAFTGNCSIIKVTLWSAIFETHRCRLLPGKNTIHIQTFTGRFLAIKHPRFSKYAIPD